MKRTLIFLIFILNFILFLAAEEPLNMPILRLNTEMHSVGITKIDTDASGKYIVTGSQDKTAKIWDAATGELIRTLRIPIGTAANDGQIYAAALSPDSKLVAVGGNTGKSWSVNFSIYVFSTSTGELLFSISDSTKA